MNWNPKQLRDDFLAAAKGGKIEILPGTIICIKPQYKPHKPPSNLPENTRAVYVFSTDTHVLKVGKVNPNTKARYTSHHYNQKSSDSNLAKSLLEDQNIVQEHELNKENVSDWIMKNTNRVNFLFDADVVGPLLLNLFEAFVQCKLSPIYEGHKSQR